MAKNRMRGLYTVPKKTGVSVMIAFTSDGETRRRTIGHVPFDPDGRPDPKHRRELRAMLDQGRTQLHQIRADIGKGLHVELGRITFSEYVDRYYRKVLRRKQLRTVKEELQRCSPEGTLGSEFGDIELADIDVDTVLEFIDKRQRNGDKLRRKGVKPATVNRDLARLRHLWNAAAIHRPPFVAGSNPVRLARGELGKALQEPRGRVRYLTYEEERRLLEEISDPDVRRLVEFAIHSGMRRGAILGLRWRDIGPVIQVSEELDKVAKGYWIAINPRVREILDELRLRGHHTEPDDLVFCRPDGKPRRSLRTAFTAALRRAGIKDFHFHDLRHTTASRIVMAGHSLKTAGDHLGHRTPHMTQRYAHLSPEHMEQAAVATMARPPENVHFLQDRRRGAAPVLHPNSEEAQARPLSY